jgi:DNA-binding NarL/FixJ family response regulator
MGQPVLEPEEFSGRSQQARRWGSSGIRDLERVDRTAEHSQKAIKIFIVDRDSMSSDLLAGALSDDQQFEGVAIQPNKLLEMLVNAQVDLVVISVDVTSSPISSFDLANAVHLAHPNIYVVMLLKEATHELVINAFRSGARGVFSRQRDMAEFLDCIQHVARGFIWAGKRETSMLLEAFSCIPAPNLLFRKDSPGLTERELQVVKCAAKGMTNKTIAIELRLSEHTVKNYLFRAFEKLGASKRVELLFYLTSQGHTLGATHVGEVNAEQGME